MTLARMLAAATLALAAAPPLHAQAPADQWLTRPVGDDVYQSYLSLFGYDRTVPLELKVLERSETDGIVTERILYTSTPGVRVTARLDRAAAAGWQGRPAVVLLHGGGISGKDGLKPMADFLVRQGFNALAIDMQYFGERRTSLMTTFSEKEKHEQLYNRPTTYLDWTVQTVRDAGRAVDVLLAQYGADPARIGLIGFSRGATVGAIVGAVEKRFGAVVLLLGTHFDAGEREHLPAACPANHIGRIAPRPLLMVNGNFDADHVKETQVAPLYALAREPKEIVWMDTGHQMPLEHMQATAEWLRAHLR
ncbi:MAG TPA: dienelactone hydrolase family protein [Longimicrobiales bacterium]|nr:dienelactone hydrolase family protein [Longimicrobiales bacterium]